MRTLKHTPVKDWGLRLQQSESTACTGNFYICRLSPPLCLDNNSAVCHGRKLLCEGDGCTGGWTSEGGFWGVRLALTYSTRASDGEAKTAWRQSNLRFHITACLIYVLSDPEGPQLVIARFGGGGGDQQQKHNPAVLSARCSLASLANSSNSIHLKQNTSSLSPKLPPSPDFTVSDNCSGS